MKLYCAGARGSIASPSCKELGFSTDIYGGNTTCYYLQAGPFKIIFDMGTGARPLGNKLAKEFGMFSPTYQGEEFLVLLTHYHKDHTDGLPFFAPAYNPYNVFHFHGFQPRETKGQWVESQVRKLLCESLETPQFPLPHRELPARKAYVDHSPMMAEVFYYECAQTLEHPVYSMSLNAPADLAVNANCVKITTIPLNHPDGCIGYRVDYLGKSLVFTTDNEPLLFLSKNIDKYAAGCDLLVMDGQYTVNQIQGMCQGFGHGEPSNCIDQAISCRARNLLITHHDPGHDDAKLNLMETDATLYMAKAIDTPLRSMSFARESQTYTLSM